MLLEDVGQEVTPPSVSQPNAGLAIWLIAIVLLFLILWFVPERHHARLS
jgi:hypothetical protein